ncbi:NOL1/NOP2/SUN domain family protein [Mucilaginibacter humi]|uniref:RsmB/NOP family class I SAM-dependent RNA methyltransferase n=1 Tax=Mucilaginibacter humi TaxID=2732510 RepID=UPI001C2EFC34|nr:RsmB/NOP family class I SAM-dependent RNA methyltransferase [Mucilaginibacter humi]
MRPSFTFDPLFHAGCYYVQEASSMFIAHILKHIKPTDPVKVLDLCAAPGGKSTLLNSAMTADDLLVANEIIKTRVPILADNLSRWGTANTIVTNNDPKDFNRLTGFFDIILVDAPCSGSGMFRKDPAAMDEWSEANVSLCHQRRERILADVYPALAEDGYLIYSTCSYSHQKTKIYWIGFAPNLNWKPCAYLLIRSGVLLKRSRRLNKPGIPVLSGQG